MSRDFVIKEIGKAKNGHPNNFIKFMHPNALKEIATALVSNRMECKALTSLNDVAAFYNISVSLVRRILDFSMIHRLMSNKQMEDSLRMLAYNQQMYAFSEKGVTSSHNHYLRIIEKRFNFFVDDFTKSYAHHKAAIRCFGSGSNFKQVLSNYNLLEREFLYSFIRIACTDMTDNEYITLIAKFFSVYSQKAGFNSYLSFIENFRNDHLDLIVSSRDFARSQLEKEFLESFDPNTLL